MRRKIYFYVAMFMLATTTLCSGAWAQQEPTATVDATAQAIQLGVPVNITTKTPGEKVTLSFKGSGGQQVSLVLSNSTYTAACPRCVVLGASILGPSGATLGSTGISNGAQSAFLHSIRLPINGTYEVVISAQGNSVGTVTVTAYSFLHVSGAVALNSPMKVNTTIPGQNARLTFNGEVGQQVSVALSDSSYASCAKCDTLAVRIMKPDGTMLGWTKLSNNATSGSIEPVTLPLNGIYAVVIDPQGERTGGVTMTLSSR